MRDETWVLMTAWVRVDGLNSIDFYRVQKLDVFPLPRFQVQASVDAMEQKWVRGLKRRFGKDAQVRVISVELYDEKPQVVV